jgi:hypothetical protein
MIAFERCPSSDAIIRTYRHIANTVSGDAAVQTTVHFSDGSEVDLHEGPAGADVLA